MQVLQLSPHYLISLAHGLTGATRVACRTLQLTCYSTFTALGVMVVWGQPWFRDTKMYWDNWPNQAMT